MFTSLIIFSTTDGHTKKICEKIVNFLNNEKLVKIVSLDEATKLDLFEFQRIIIGASIRYGKHSRELYKFIKINKRILDQKQSVFFSVNVVARKSEKNSPETNPYIKKFFKKTKWIPKKVGVFAGKVDYPNYNLFNRFAIRFIMLVTKGPTDITKSYEFTNWDVVKKFAQDLDNL